MKPVADSIYMAVRDLRNLARQPWFVAITLIQPIIWLLLFGQLFHKIIEIPGFDSNNYTAFLTPGVVVMNAFYSGGWSGMGMVNDLDRGVMDRFLVTPVSRTAIIIGRMIQVAVTTIIQAAILIVLGLLMGADWPHASAGIPILFAAAILLAVPFAALSNALGLLLRQEESVIGANQFILLPLTFLSSVFLAQVLMPDWMQTGAQFNPLNWAVTAGRDSLVSTNPDWNNVLIHLAYLGALTVVSTWLAARAFRTYQRSI
jgi:ABC-2 type transport system permease protein